MSRPCVYALIDPRDGRTYYVGQTVRLAVRRHAHDSSGDPRYAHDPDAVDGWAARLRAEGVRPQVVILEEDPPDGLDTAERRWIRRCLQRGEPLMNYRGIRFDEQRPLGLPFTEAERRRFPLRRWREAHGLSKDDLIWALSTAMDSHVKMSAVIHRLELGHYEATGQQPSRRMLGRINDVQRFTGLPLRA